MNIQIFNLLCLFFLLSTTSYSQQKYLTRTAHLNVQSSNNVVDVEADNYQVVSTLDPQTGAVNFTGLLKSFEFKLGAADQIFNSKMVDVSAHPKLIFEGKVNNIHALKLDTPGEYKIRIVGTLFLWGQERNTSANGYITVLADGSLKAHSNFIMKIEEESVNKINQIMKEKLPAAINVNTQTLGISRNINVELDMSYRKR